MAYINTGAYAGMSRPASKAALKRALAADPGSVRFDVTSPIGPRGSDHITATAEDIGTDKLSVCGPDPYRTRNWYATVEVRGGKVRLS